jgi:hypothetical protein
MGPWCDLKRNVWTPPNLNEESASARQLALAEQHFSSEVGPLERFSVGALEAKTGPHRPASTTVGAASGAKDSGLVFAGSVRAGACV